MPQPGFPPVDSEPATAPPMSSRTPLQSAFPVSADRNPAPLPLQPVNPPLQPAKPFSQPANPLLQPVNPPLQPANPPLHPVKPSLQPINPPLQPANTPSQQPAGESYSKVPVSSLAEAALPNNQGDELPSILYEVIEKGKGCAVCGSG